jgi:hypothetical protein
MKSDLIWPLPGQTRTFHSIEIAAAASLDTRALSQVMLRATNPAVENAPDSIGFLVPGDTASDRWLEYRWHVWWALSGFWRDDFSIPGGGDIINIARPDGALTYVSMEKILYTSQGPSNTAGWQHASAAGGFQLPTVEERLVEFPLIRPRLPESDWHLESRQDEIYLGRPAIRVRTTRRADSIRMRDSRLSGFWPGVDEYECVIDFEQHVCMSVTGIVDGVSVATISVERMTVDAELAPTIFEFSPPSGTRIVRASEQTSAWERR